MDFVFTLLNKNNNVHGAIDFSRGKTRPKITIECVGWTFLTNMQW